MVYLFNRVKPWVILVHSSGFVEKHWGNRWVSVLDGKLWGTGNNLLSISLYIYSILQYIIYICRITYIISMYVCIYIYVRIVV